MNDLYARVTERILEKLRTGVAPWVRDWDASTVGMTCIPCNIATGRHYRGVNIPLLWIAADERGWPNLWVGYKQARTIGGQVRKDEDGTTIVKVDSFVPKEDRDLPPDQQRRFSYLSWLSVFNVAQCDGIPRPESSVATTPPEIRYQRAASLVEASKVRVVEGPPGYCPIRDLVAMPGLQSYQTEERYWSSFLHELTHWTGHPSRLNRELSLDYESAAYAREELVAEMGSAFLCATLGIQANLQHAAYINSWISLLEHDQRALVSAASKASSASDFILNLEKPS